METTFKELGQLFKLSNSDYRQLKAGLKNKIKLIDSKRAVVTDNWLIEILKEFRKGDVYDCYEVCRQFAISRNRLNHLVKENLVSYFQLVSAKGSKLLFLKSELEKEQKFWLIHSSRNDKAKLSRVTELAMSSLIEEGEFSKRDFEIFSMYYFHDASYPEIAAKFNLSIPTIHNLIGTNNLKVFYRLRKYGQYKKEIESLKKKIAHYKSQYHDEKEKREMAENLHDDLKKLFKDTVVAKKEYSPEIVIKKITELNLSIRALNCLTSVGIETIGDLLNFRKENLIKIINLGKKTLAEIENVFHELENSSQS